MDYCGDCGKEVVYNTIGSIPIGATLGLSVLYTIFWDQYRHFNRWLHLQVVNANVLSQNTSVQY